MNAHGEPKSNHGTNGLRSAARLAKRSAFEDLIAVMERPLLYYATSLTGNPDSALDVLQEVWIKVFRGIRKLKDPGSLRSWLYSITHGIAVDRIRKNYVAGTGRADSVRGVSRKPKSRRSPKKMRRRFIGHWVKSVSSIARFWSCIFLRIYRWPRSQRLWDAAKARSNPASITQNEP